MAKIEAMLSSEERSAIAIKAVNRLIADVEARRLLENKELAEVIKVCIRETQPRLLRDLKFVLDQQELNRPELETVRRLFAEQFPSKERTGIDVLKFYGWLEQHRPDLLTRGDGDPYQTLKVDLSGLFKD